MSTKFYQVLKKIMKPGKLAQYRLRNIKKSTTNDIITYVSVILGIAVLAHCYPFRSVGQFVLSVLWALFLFLVAVVVLTHVVPKAVLLLSLVFWLPAKLYDLCEDKANHVSRRRKRGTVNKAPRAEVGIKYFIEREKGVQVNHAMPLK